MLCPTEREGCLQEQAGGPNEQRVSGQSQPWVFQAPRETERQKRHGKLEEGQNGSNGEIKPKENLR